MLPKFLAPYSQYVTRKTVAIEDDGGTKTATNGALSDRILCNLLPSRWISYLCLVLKPFSSDKSIQKSPKT